MPLKYRILFLNDFLSRHFHTSRPSVAILGGPARAPPTPPPADYNVPAADTGRMLLVGLVEGPPHHWWYTRLDRLLPGRTARAVRLKILADQLVAAPLFAFTFFVGVDLLEGRSLSEGVQEFKRKFPEVYLVRRAGRWGRCSRGEGGMNGVLEVRLLAARYISSRINTHYLGWWYHESWWFVEGCSNCSSRELKF